MDTALGHIGAYNHLNLVTKGGGLITGVCDRARRKPVVAFREEELADLARPAREPAKLTWSGALPAWAAIRHPSDGSAIQVDVEGRTFTLTDRPYVQYPGPDGFGRGLTCHMVATDRPDRIAVLLTVVLPDRVRHRVHWAGEADGEGTFRLAHGMRVSVLTDLPWTWDGSACTVETGDAEGSVTYLIESLVDTGRLHRTVIVAAPGHEREALRVRASLGRDFVPCFVVGGTEWSEPETAAALLADLPGAQVLTLGLSAPGGLDALDTLDIEVAPVDTVDRSVDGPLPGPRATTVLAPDRPEAYGPALHLALHLDADLAFGPPDGDRLRWVDGTGTPLRTWPLADLLGRALSGEGRDGLGDQQAGSGELVVCENTVVDLLACQAVGYAQVRGCRIAFVPEIPDGEPPAGLSDAAGVTWLRERAAAAVPTALRAPEADTLTIFTRHLPLHLTPLPPADGKARHWMDRYRLAHVPGQLGSVLFPRKLRGSLEPAPPVSFGVVFDALSDPSDAKGVVTEGVAFVDRLQRGLSHPVVLAGRAAARGAVLEAALRHLDTDLVLLIAHGRDDHLQDADNKLIPDSVISGWQLRGRPVVFNNSCTSWTTTSRAFLRAGARAVVATLWPVGNEFATRVATAVSEQLHRPDGPDIAALLREALTDATDGPGAAAYDEDDVAARATYLFVGLPDTAFRDRPVFGRSETVQLLTHALMRLYETFAALIKEGQPELARALHHGSTRFLRERLTALLVPGEPPLHLGPPWEMLTLLDVDLVLARLNNALCRLLLGVLPPQQLSGPAGEMGVTLHQAVDELKSMQERYDRHMGTEGEDGGGLLLNNVFWIGLLADFAFSEVLPCVRAVAPLPLDGSEEVARSWFGLAAALVTTPTDRAPDGSVSDAVVITRLREGIRVEVAAPEPEDGGEVPDQEVDLLALAVDKAKLADDFGAARVLMGEPAAALAFFEVARDLARPGTPVAADAAAHLADMRWLLEQDSGDDLTRHHQALAGQRVGSDERGVSITAAHLLFRAAFSGARMRPGFVATALDVVGALESAHERLSARCHLLSAAACYRASRRDHAGAARAQAEIVGHLETDAAASASYVPALARWYRRDGDHPRAFGRAYADGEALERAGLHDAAMRSFLAAAECAVDAYAAGPSNACLDRFLECSRRLGRLHGRRPPRNQRKLEERLREVWEQTVSAQEQWAARGQVQRALDAYRAARSWSYSAKDAAWEQLDRAYHQRNVEAVRRLAVQGCLRREAVVRVVTDGTVDIDLTTVRRDASSGEDPSPVIGCVPFPDAPVADTPPADAPLLVAGVAVFQLRDGDSVTLRHSARPAPEPTADVLYQAVWGSTLVPHQVEVRLPPGTEPGAVDCVALSEPGPRVEVHPGTETAGRRIVLSPPDDEGAACWLARLTILRAAPAQ